MTNNRMNLSKKKKFLLKTRTQFDGSSSDLNDAAISFRDGLHSQMVSVTLQQPTSNSLIIQALIQKICIYMEEDGKRREMLYSAICRMLNESKVIGLDFSLDELWPLKQKLCNMLSLFFNQVHKNICSQGFGSCTSLSVRNVFDCVRTDYAIHPSRYQQSFEELETIAAGGFGVVCKARNKVDGITYAIKKIKFMYTNDIEFEKVVREVRSFAMLKHQNIVNYNNSWLENNIVTESRVYTTSSDSESYFSDSELRMGNSSQKMKSSGAHAISPVANFSLETSIDDGDFSGQSSNLTTHVRNSLSPPASVDSHSVIINSEVQIFHQNITIEKNCQSNVLNTSVNRIKQSTEVCTSKLAPLNDLNYYVTDESSLHDFQVIHRTENETANSDSKSHLIHQVDEAGDYKHPTRRRRHSSGPTCSAVNQHAETESSLKVFSHPKSCDRMNSLDLDLRRNTVVPKKANVKWDISNLNVMATLYIQMELCDRSLRDWLDEEANLLPSCRKPDEIFGNALNMFQQIVQGVEHIHSKSIIHRDLKPKNIFLCSGGFIKIGDFGLAALCTHMDDSEFFHSRCTCSHTQGLGTAPYCAPEQRKGNSYDNKVDIYSLGIILIELLHNYRTRMEFFTTVEKILEGHIPIEFVDIWHKKVVSLIRKLVSPCPQERLEAKDVLIYLKEFQVAESFATNSSHQEIAIRNNEAQEIFRLRAQISTLERQLAEQDKTIKELQLKLLYSRNCDSFV